jgi:hypothetical protein
MKKQLLFSFVFILSLILLGSGFKFAQASDPGCNGSGPYSITTGQLCTTTGTSSNLSASASTFQIGSKGASVLALQQTLTNAGYSVGKIDGVYGKKTAAAANAYYKIHPCALNSGSSACGPLPIVPIVPITTPPTNPAPISPTIAAKAGDVVSVNYTGRLTNGTVFDSNVDSKFGHVTPFVFTLGAGQVIAGWDKGVVGMTVGQTKTLTIPPADAYGAVGAPPTIPANATLIFDITLLSINGNTSVTPPTTSLSPITITSPNGGEQWTQGTTHAISWTDSSVTQTPCPPQPVCTSGQACPMYRIACPVTVNLYDISLTGKAFSQTIMSGVSGASYSWTIPSSLPLDASPFDVQVCKTGTTVCGTSNQFNIVSGTTTSNPIVLPSNISAQVSTITSTNISGGVAPYSIATQPNSAIAVATINNSTLTLQGNAVGSTAVVVKDSSGQTASATITVSASTSLATPTLDVANSTSSQYISAGNTTGAISATKADFNFTPIGGTATITELKFATNGTSGAITSVTVNGVSAPVVGGVAYLTGLNILVGVNGAGGTDVVAYVSYAPVGANGVPSGSTAGITLTSVKYTSNSTSSSLTNLSVSAPTMTLVASQPTLNLSSSTLPFNAATNILVGSLTITANAAGNVSLIQIPLNMSISGATNLGFVQLADANNNIVSTSTPSCTSSITGAGLLAASCSVSFIGGHYVISAGQSQTFKIYEGVAGAINSGAYISASLGNPSNFLWNDISGQGTSNLSGTLLNNYPTNTVTVNYSGTTTTPTPTITLTAPSGGESWMLGETHTITWNQSAAFSGVSVTLQNYGIPNGTTSLMATIASGLTTPSGQNSYTWTIPTTLSLGNATNPTTTGYQICVGYGNNSSDWASGCSNKFNISPATVTANPINIPVQTGTASVLGAESYTFTLKLQMGSTGNEVVELQKFLNNAGYDVGATDGIFGAKVEAAVVKFEVANNLVGDGIVGPAVRALLNK